MAVGPSVAQVYAANKTVVSASHSCCQHKADKPSNTSDKKSCCGDTCNNPFMSCSCCAAFFVEQPQYSLEAYTVFTKAIPVTNDQFISRFSSDCFHPPRIA